MIAILAIADDLKTHVEKCEVCKLDKDKFCDTAKNMYAYCLIAICRSENVPRYAVEQLPAIKRVGGINAVAAWRDSQTATRNPG